MNRRPKEWLCRLSIPPWSTHKWSALFPIGEMRVRGKDLIASRIGSGLSRSQNVNFSKSHVCPLIFRWVRFEMSPSPPSQPYFVSSRNTYPRQPTVTQHSDSQWSQKTWPLHTIGCWNIQSPFMYAVYLCLPPLLCCFIWFWHWGQNHFPLGASASPTHP